MKKKILFVTCTRADYGKLKSLITSTQKNNNFISKVFVSGMHNMEVYGLSYTELLKDNIRGIYRYNNQSKTSKMDQILMNTMKGFSPFLTKFKLHASILKLLFCIL